MSEHLAIAVIGRKRTGKSTYLRNLAIKLSGPVIIVDPNNSPAYSMFPELELDQIKKMKNGIGRYYLTDTDRMFNDLYEVVHYKNKKVKPFHGTWCFDDATKYIDSHPTKQQKALLVDHRMYGLNILFTFHSLAGNMGVPGWLWKMLTHVTLFKTQDNIDENPRKYIDSIVNFKDILPAWQSVMKNKDNYYHKTIETLI